MSGWLAGPALYRILKLNSYFISDEQYDVQWLRGYACNGVGNGYRDPNGGLDQPSFMLYSS